MSYFKFLLVLGGVVMLASCARKASLPETYGDAASTGTDGSGASNNETRVPDIVATDSAAGDVAGVESVSSGTSGEMDSVDSELPDSHNKLEIDGTVDDSTDSGEVSTSIDAVDDTKVEEVGSSYDFPVSSNQLCMCWKKGDMCWFPMLEPTPKYPDMACPEGEGCTGDIGAYTTASVADIEAGGVCRRLCKLSGAKVQGAGGCAVDEECKLVKIHGAENVVYTTVGMCLGKLVSTTPVDCQKTPEHPDCDKKPE